MGGWKTWAGSLIAIGLGIYMIIFHPDRFEYGAGLVSIGLISMGIGHKIEKTGNGKL